MLLFPLPLILICEISQRVAKRNAREQKYADLVLQPRCAVCPQVRGRSAGRNRFSAAGRRFPDFVGSA